MFLLHPQLSNKQLAELCHRLAVETDSGIDVRRTWQREADMARGRSHSYFEGIRDAISRGDSLTDAFSRTGTLFPQLFIEMTHVGEQTGTLGKVFHRLEMHYRRQVQAQRIFFGAIAWPMFELAFAIFVVGALIWILGIIAQRNNGHPIDILGFGLVGTRGLIIYSSFITFLGLCVTGLVIAVKRGMLWTRPLQRAVYRIPVIGHALERIALARLSWALHLTLNVAMDIRQLLPLSLRATGSDYYVQHTDQIVDDITHGNPIHVAFARAHVFPLDFLDAITVAEESGRLVESMDHLSGRYEEEAGIAIKALATTFGWMIGFGVMAIIVFLIFRLFSFYLGSINDALHMTR
jgi:type II secretory pathway component PulF